MEPFSVETKDHVAWLTLDNPDKRNIMGESFFTGLKNHFDRFHEDPEVRVVVIKAAGKSFTAGLDLMEAGSLVADKSASGRVRLRQNIEKIQESMNAIERCCKPVIAAVHSHCIGGGVDMISACDVRMASEDAVFAIRETKIAIIADIGTLQRLPHIIGQAWTSELALSGRDFTAAEAKEIGLITRLCGSRESLYLEASALAAEIAENAPLTVQGIKEVLLFNRDHGVYPGLKYVAQRNAAEIISDDLMEAFTAFLEKRKPEFKGN